MIVSSTENDFGDFYQFSCKRENITISENTTIKQNVSEAFVEADTFTVAQFIHHQSVAAVIILLASLSQGGFSQVLFNKKQGTRIKPQIIAFKSCSNCCGNKNKKCPTSKYKKMKKNYIVLLCLL